MRPEARVTSCRMRSEPEGDVALQDLARARIDQRVAVGPAARGAMHPVHDVVADVHRVGVLGQDADLVGVAEARPLEGLLPPGGAVDERAADGLGGGVVDVVDDRLHHLRHRRRRVLLLQAVARDEALLDRRGERAGVVVDLDAEEAGARVQLPRRVAGGRELHERVMLADGDGVRGRRHGGDERARAVARHEGDRGFDLGVAREGPGARQVDRAARGIDGVRALLGVAQPRGHAVGVAQEEVGGVDADPAPGLGLDLERPQDGGSERLLDRLLLGGGAAEGAEARVALDEQDLGSHAIEADEARLAELVAVEADGVGADAAR